MNLLLPIDHEQVSILREQLRVSAKEYDAAAFGSPKTAEERYAHRILRARGVLGLGAFKHDACYDMPAPTQD